MTESEAVLKYQILHERAESCGVKLRPGGEEGFNISVLSAGKGWTIITYTSLEDVAIFIKGYELGYGAGTDKA